MAVTEKAARPPDASPHESPDDRRPPARWRRILSAVPWGIVGPIVSVALFGGALAVLAHILRNVKADDVIAVFATTSNSALALSVLFTAFSYLSLTGYDGLALRQVGAKDVPYSTAAIGSFTSYAISYTLGFPLFTAAAVRYRVYGQAGLTAPQIAALTLVCTLTFWLGMGSVVAVGLIFFPNAIAGIDQFPPGGNIAIGIGILAVVAGYTLFVSTKRRVIAVEGWSFALPGGKVTVAQLGLGVFDVCAGAGAFYMLLPGHADTPFLTVAVIYVLAAILGVISHAPGGLGVFEATMLIALPSIPKDQLLGSILLFRVIYYFVPFTLALATLGAYELARRRHWVDRLVDLSADVMKPLAPILLGAAVFMIGAAILVTGSLPISDERRETLAAIAPLPLVEGAHVLAAIAGVALLFLARGLFRRLANAWFVSGLLLVLVTLLAILRAADLRVALASLAVMTVLLSSRAAFPRRAPFFNQSLSPWWLAAIVTVLAAVIWVGTFAFAHATYSPTLWATFSFSDDLPRFLRGSAAAILTAFVFTALSFRRRPRGTGAETLPADLHAILATAPDPRSRLSLLPDKTILASDAGDAFLMHAARGASNIALGDPVGPPDRAQELLWAFRERAERRAHWPVIVAASQQMRSLYLEAGFALTHIGDRATVDLATLPAEPFPEAGEVTAWADAEALSLDLVPAGAAAPLLPALEAVSQAWLAASNARENFFTIGQATPDWLLANDCAVLRRAGEIVGFAVVLHGAGGREEAVDILRYWPDLGLRAMDFMLLRLMRLARARGVSRFDLGLTPTPDLAADALGPTMSRVSPALFGFGDHIHDFDALRAFKARFSPDFTPRFLACPGSWAIPHIILDVTALIERGPQPTLSSQRVAAGG